MDSILNSSLLLYMLPSLVALIAIAVIVGALLYFRRQRPKPLNQHAAFKHSAVLINLATKEQHQIDAIPWRIGRSRTNGLSIDDHSVSRVHAEINLDEQGTFHICDLESLNGVYVNESRTDISTLEKDDLVDIGDIRFKFEVRD